MPPHVQGHSIKNPAFEALHPRDRSGRDAGQFVDVVGLFKMLGGRWDAERNVWLVPQSNRAALKKALDDIGMDAIHVPPGMRPMNDADRTARFGPGTKIPPAWTDVMVATDPNAAVLVVGRDAAGRKQRIQSVAFSEEGAAAKFARVRHLDAHIDDVDEKLSEQAPKSDTATVAMLIRKMGLRPGSVKDTKAKVKAYGATTLERRHVKVRGDLVSLDFIGKEGVRNRLEIEDAELAKLMKRAIRGKQGHERLWDVNDKRVNAWFKQHAFGTTAKDFRTRLATAEARRFLQGFDAPSSDKEARLQQLRTGDHVSKILGNTRKQALESYIDPSVFDTTSTKSMGRDDLIPGTRVVHRDGRLGTIQGEELESLGKGLSVVHAVVNYDDGTSGRANPIALTPAPHLDERKITPPTDTPTGTYHAGQRVFAKNGHELEVLPVDQRAADHAASQGGIWAKDHDNGGKHSVYQLDSIIGTRDDLHEMVGLKPGDAVSLDDGSSAIVARVFPNDVDLRPIGHDGFKENFRVRHGARGMKKIEGTGDVKVGDAVQLPDGRLGYVTHIDGVIAEIRKQDGSGGVRLPHGPLKKVDDSEWTRDYERGKSLRTQAQAVQAGEFRFQQLLETPELKAKHAELEQVEKDLADWEAENGPEMSVDDWVKWSRDKTWSEREALDETRRPGRELRTRKWQLRRDISDGLGRSLRTELQRRRTLAPKGTMEIRHVGSKSGNDRIERQVEHAGAKLPLSWIRKVGKVGVEFASGRGQWNGRRIQSNNQSTTMHELGHAIEERNPRLKALITEFLNARIATSKHSYPVPVDSRYPNEVGYPDVFGEAYTGKIYKDGSTEVLSMGLQSLFYKPDWFKSDPWHDDPEFRHFLLGLLFDHDLTEEEKALDLSADMPDPNLPSTSGTGNLGTFRAIVSKKEVDARLIRYAPDGKKVYVEAGGRKTWIDASKIVTGGRTEVTKPHAVDAKDVSLEPGTKGGTFIAVSKNGTEVGRVHKQANGWALERSDGFTVTAPTKEEVVAKAFVGEAPTLSAAENAKIALDRLDEEAHNAREKAIGRQKVDQRQKREPPKPPTGDPKPPDAPGGRPGAARREQMAKAFYAGYEEGEELTGGNMSLSVKRVTLSDGSMGVLKGSEWDGESRREVLASVVANALGFDSHAIEVGDKKVLTTFVKGTPGAQVNGQGLGPKSRTPSFNVPGEIVDLPGAREMGVMDWLIRNRDRHDLNWLLDENGKVAPIDHGMTFFTPDGADRDVPRSPFAEHWVGYTDKPSARSGFGVDPALRARPKNPKVGELKPKVSKAYLTELRSRLELGRAEFSDDEWQAVMLRLDMLMAAAPDTIAGESPMEAMT